MRRPAVQVALLFLAFVAVAVGIVVWRHAHRTHRIPDDPNFDKCIAAIRLPGATIPTDPLGNPIPGYTLDPDVQNLIHKYCPDPTQFTPIPSRS